MRKSLLVLPLLAAGFVIACGSSAAPRSGFDQDKDPTEAADAGPEAASSDPGFKQGVDDNDSDDPDAGGCANSSTSLTRTPVVLEFVVDESGSMGGDKWTAQRDALLAAFEEMKNVADPAFFVGLQLFDDQPNTKVKPKPLTDPDHYDDLVDIIDKPSPKGGGTGSEKALQAGFAVVDGFKPPASSGLDTTSIKRVLVFMSDGAPNGGATEQAKCEELVTEEFQQAPPAGPVNTFSIGVGPFPSSGGYDPAFMGRLAVAGGTAPANCDPVSTDPAGVCHYQVTPGRDAAAMQAAFLAAINNIRSLSSSCEFKINVTDDSDLTKVEIKMKTADGKTLTVKKGGNNGWTFDNESSPTKIILHGKSCSASSATVSGSIDVKFGCKGAY